VQHSGEFGILKLITTIMAEVDPWLGGKPPGGVSPYFYKDRQVGWVFEVGKITTEAKKLQRDVPRSKKFSFKEFGESAKAAAEDYQRQFAKDHGLAFKNQYRHRIDPGDGLPYIEFHTRDTKRKNHYPKCDIEDLSLLEEHTWCVHKNGNNIYVATNVRIDDKRTVKYFHSLKCPDWPEVDHFSESSEENRNGLDNRGKHLRDGSGGVNNSNRRLQKNNKSGVNGVSYHDRGKYWYVRIEHNKTLCAEKKFYGPEDKTDPSYHAACVYQREQAKKVGNTNGQMPDDADPDK